MTSDYLWWQRGIIYQIYPRSFMDSNADGIGDLKGITSRLDYLNWLGIDAIWMSPINPSPMVDFGYDVSDYRDIDQIFGTLEDFDELIAEAHRHDIKIIFDFVPNHTSDQHPWFVESRSSRDNPKRDWYIWRDPAPDGSKPNNWLSSFGGSGWEWDESTNQYYFHQYFKEQPDLNWANPEVREAMLDNMRFWLDRGVDGFRLDAVWHLAKDPELRDNPPNPEWTPEMSPYRSLIPAFNSDLHAHVRSAARNARGGRRIRRSPADWRDLSARLSGWSRITARTARSCTCRTISICCYSRGTQPTSRLWSTSTRDACLRSPGRTGS